MKKLLLGLGTIAAITAPVAAVVACGTSHDDHITLSFNQSMNKQQFDAVLSRYTDFAPKIQAIIDGEGSENEKTKKLHQFYVSMPTFTFKLDGLTMQLDFKTMTKDSSKGIHEREVFEPKLHELADKLGSTLHFDFS